jgi:hypothetical protein
METFEEDFKRFAGQHSYYKHLDILGADRCMVLKIGQQPRHSICPDVDDTTNLHWWFLTPSECEQQGFPTKYRININKFTSSDSDCFMLSYFTFKSGNPTEFEFLSKHHPDIMNDLYNGKSVNFISRERSRQLEVARQVAWSYINEID